MRAADGPFFDFVVANFGSGVSPRSMLVVGIGKGIYLIAIALCGDGFAKGTHRTSAKRRLRHSEEQIVAILREQEAGAKTADVCSSTGSERNVRLKKLFADAVLDNAMLKSCCQKR